MLIAIKDSLAFMTTKERVWWLILTALRSLLSLIDLVGILAIGFVVTSTAVFLTSGSDSARVLEFAGLEIPAVNAQTLPLVAAAVLFLFLAKAFLSVALTKKAAYFVATVEARSAKVIAELSFGRDLADARKHSPEEVTFAIQVGSPSAFNGLLNSANIFVTEASLFLVICIGFLIVDPISTVAAIAYFGLIAFIIQYFIGSLMSNAGQVAAEGALKANSTISDLLSVFRELLVLGRREKYIEAIYEARAKTSRSAAEQYYLSGMPRYIIEAALLVGISLFILAQSLSGDFVKSAATVGVFLSGGFRLTAAMLPLQGSLLTIKSLIPSAVTAHRIIKPQNDRTLAFQRELACDSNREYLASTEPIGVVFDEVSFSYQDSENLALREVSFVIEPGAQVALMGPSGAGKSTIADLLCGVLNPTHGHILFSTSNSQPNPDRARGTLSYVPQRPGLVAGSILENIALGEDIGEISRARALDALRLAHLEELVSNLPDGLDTQLGKLKDGLSGGQMQRLGLARALYSGPSLLVMDEATSALDAESEAEIQRALEEMRGKVTVVLIAHRLNTIQHADKVFLVEDGRVKDSGTFKELVSRNRSVERVVDLMSVEKD